jgi:hypothetical protein
LETNSQHRTGGGKSLLFRIHRFAENGVAELELRRDSRRGEVLCLFVKYWLKSLQMDVEEPVRGYFEWQINELKFGSWAKKLSKELNK